MADERAEIVLDAPPGVEGGYTMVPNWVLRDPDLGSSDKMVYAALLSYAWDPARRSTFTGQQTIATDLGVDVATVKRSMSRLRKAGLLTSERRGLGRTSIHTLKWQSAPTDGAERADRRGTSAPTVGAPARRHEEDAVEEDAVSVPPNPPPTGGSRSRGITNEHVDEILAFGADLCGWTHRTGTTRPRAISKSIRARLNEQVEDGNVGRAVNRAKAVIDEKHTQTSEQQNGGQRMRFDVQYLTATTLFRPSHFEQYLDEARQRARRQR